MHFLMPTKLDDWKAFEVAGIVGVLGRGQDGQFYVIDAFDSNTVPSARQLALDERFGSWVVAASGMDNIRFDVFLMPNSEQNRRDDVITLLERSCGFRTDHVNAQYAHAV
jgi:hypothetical protein